MAKMTCSQIEARRHVPAPMGNEENSSVDFTLPLGEHPRSEGSNSPAALVASSDENVLQGVAEIVLQCGLATFLAFTVEESRRILEKQTVSLVVCDDRLVDGKYEDILSETAPSPLKTPVVVVSPTGDWPDYLKAINAGAFDYLAYPPIPGDLPRAIHDALMSRTASGFQDTKSKFVSSKGEML
ncbi:MAG: hypothetical protein WCA91_23945 [Candidatus Acidiferrales bacterium]